MKALSYIAALVLLFAPAAIAGKGAYVRVFNLTDTALDLSTVVDGFSGESAKERRLSGRIPPRSAFPADGSVYVEENNIFSASHLIFRFNSNRGSPRIDVRYTSSYNEFYRTNDEELYVSSALYGFSGSGSQWVINIFVSQQNFTPANWMSQIRDNVNLAQLLIPGTHDTATYPSILPFVATQEANIRQQLDAGIRYFDLRGGWDRSNSLVQFESDSNFLVYHGPVALFGVWFTDVFDDTVRFLRAHPEETVLVQIKIDHDPYPRPVESIARALVARYGDYFFTENRIPTLGEARGKIVLLNRFSDATDFGFNVRKWGGAPKDAPFQVQDDYDSLIPEKNDLVRNFFNTACRPSADKPGAERLNINFVSFAALGAAYTPIQGALGWTAGGNRADGLNIRIAKFLSDLDSIPNYQAVVPIDAVLDDRNPTDGFVQEMLSFNFRRFGREGDTPRMGQEYYLRPKSAPESLLTVILDDTPQASMSQRLAPRSGARQVFTLEDAPGNTFRLATLDRNGQPLYLRAMGNGRVVAVASNPGDPGQFWRFDRWRNSGYFFIYSVADGRAISAARGDRVEVSPNGDRDARLWMFDKVE